MADDPPFYLTRSSPVYAGSINPAPPDQSPPACSACAVPGVRDRLVGAREGSIDSTSEEYRSLIDDLTVQNRRLRQKLKKYEKLHCSHLQKDKLFEVRIHALPAAKVHQLERALRELACNEDDAPIPPESSFAAVPSLQPKLGLSLFPPSSSTTSCSKMVDSAYASMSASGQTLHSRVHSNPTGARRIQEPSVQMYAKRRSGDSSRKAMSHGLLPVRSWNLSEKAKQKMVVRRLERLFTGQAAASLGLSHSRNRQNPESEGPQDVLDADMHEANAGLRHHQIQGAREASILPPGADVQTDSSGRSHRRSQSQRIGDTGSSRSSSGISSGVEGPAQRATYLTDLDPAENLKYIRHLGLLMPSNTIDTNFGSSDGWLYLNLLINLAQLHTFNVTPEFVKKSISTWSSRLELSPDGQKLRWTGGIKGSSFSSNSDEDLLRLGQSQSPGLVLRLSDESGASGDGEDEPHAGHKSDNVHASDLGRESLAAKAEISAKDRSFTHRQAGMRQDFSYKPMFFHATRSDEENEFNLDRPWSSSDSTDSANHSRHASNHQRHLRLNSQPGHGRKATGPIIFYKEATFCTDLSGKSGRANTVDIDYQRYINEPIGSGNDVRQPGSRGNLHAIYASPTSECMRQEANSGTAASRPLLKDGQNLNNHTMCGDGSPVYMTASGLGGVQPQDNFIIRVKVQHCGVENPFPKLTRYSNPTSRVKRIFHRVPPGNINVFLDPNVRPRKDPQSPAAGIKIVSVVTTKLPPSTLPDPSYIYFPSSSDLDEDDEENSSTAESPRMNTRSRSYCTGDFSADNEVQAPLASLWISSAETSEETSDTPSDDVSDDSSVDFLAHARVVDPTLVAAREREFDAGMERALDELRAGSSAATAAGGSGYTSGWSDSLPSESNPAVSEAGLRFDNGGRVTMNALTDGRDETGDEDTDEDEHEHTEDDDAEAEHR